MVNILKFFSEVGKLRFLKRKWDIRGVPKEDSESSADHAFRLSLLSWVLAEKEKLDIAQVIKMSLVHDLCNVYVGEVTPYDKFLTGNPDKDKVILKGLPRYSKEQKEQMTQERRMREEQALEELLSFAPGDFAKEVKALWLDYEFVRTPEARFVRQIDRIEPLLQAVEYKREGKIEDIDVYWYQAKEWIDNKNLLKFVEELDHNFYDKKLNKKNSKELVSR